MERNVNMFLISDEVIDMVAGTKPISADQVRRWLTAERNIYQNCIRGQQESIDDYLKRIDELTNYDYEARIEELENQVSKLDIERYEWMEKYNNLKSALKELTEE
jgi:chromosome segregation ATPase